MRIRGDDALLEAAYRGARLVVVPSLYEGFGLPSLEALACGAPLLISDARALRETAGFDVPHVEKAGSSEAWELALYRSLSSCPLSSGGIARARQTTERFSWANTAFATIRGYSAFA
jgi:glycosyltransferase involved in cell wall biosynthesis